MLCFHFTDCMQGRREGPLLYFALTCVLVVRNAWFPTNERKHSRKTRRNALVLDPLPFASRSVIYVHVSGNHSPP